MPTIARLINTNDIDPSAPGFRPDAKLNLPELGWALLPDGLSGNDLGSIFQVNGQMLVVANWYWAAQCVPTLASEEGADPVAVRTPYLEIWLIDVAEAQKRQRTAAMAQAGVGAKRLFVPTSPGQLNGSARA